MPGSSSACCVTHRECRGRKKKGGFGVAKLYSVYSSHHDDSSDGTESRQQGRNHGSQQVHTAGVDVRREKRRPPEKKRLLGGIKKTKTIWEKWDETIKEEEKLQSDKDVTVQCTDFCEVTTSDVHAVLRHAPADLRGGTLLQHPRVLVATVAYQENPHLCLQILHAAKCPVFRGAYILLRVLTDTKSQEAQGLLEEI